MHKTWLFRSSRCGLVVVALLFCHFLSFAQLFAYAEGSIQTTASSKDVVVKLAITKDGKAKKIHVVSGPIELRQAAIDAVSQYSFPSRGVEINTTLTVKFPMGEDGKPQTKAVIGPSTTQQQN